MKISSKSTIVLVLTVLLLLVVQSIRLNLFFKGASLSQISPAEYVYGESLKLADTDKDQTTQKHYLVLHDTNDTAEMHNISMLLDNIQVRYETMLISEKRNSYQDIDMVLILAHGAGDIADLDKILNYVQQGGKLAYLGNGNMGQDDLLKVKNEFFGIKSWNDELLTNRVVFRTELLSGITGSIDLGSEYFPDDKYFEELDVNLQEDCLIHMADAAGNPMIWERKIVNGSVMVLNIGRYDSKVIRGLLTGALTVFDGLVVYPVIGSAVVFIDDFPADYRTEPLLLKENYGRNFQRYILEIWWPDIAIQMNRYHFKVTTAFIQTYDDLVNGPFSENKAIEITLQRLVNEVLKSGGEVSFHGYNHQPLFLTQSRMSLYGYKAWPSSTMIAAAIQSSIQFFHTSFAGYQFYTYVPPSNLLEPVAIKALKQGIPTLRTISGIYFGVTTEDSGENPDDFTQEFTVDDQYGIALPRVTAGSFFTDAVQFFMASAVTTNGIVNHFIHPDDILDPDRSQGLLWEQLYQENEKLLAGIDKRYGWLSKDTAAQASQKLKKAHFAKLYYVRGRNTIQIACDNFDTDLSVIVVSKEVILAGKGYDVKRVDSQRYLVTMHQNKVTLEVKAS